VILKAAPIGIRRRHLMESFKSLSALLDKAEHCPIGQSDDRLHSTDDTGFTYLAGGGQVSMRSQKNLTKDMSLGKSPEGKGVKFIHSLFIGQPWDTLTSHHQPPRTTRNSRPRDTFIEESNSPIPETAGGQRW